jgi:hypothetical protein
MGIVPHQMNPELTASLQREVAFFMENGFLVIRRCHHPVSGEVTS